MFPQDGQVEGLVKKIQTGLDTIEKGLKKKLEAQPTAPTRETFYEEIVADGSTVQNGTNDGQQQGNNSNLNGDSTPSQGA